MCSQIIHCPVEMTVLSGVERSAASLFLTRGWHILCHMTKILLKVNLYGLVAKDFQCRECSIVFFL